MPKHPQQQSQKQVANQFVVRFPSDAEELHTCASMLQDSSYYDDNCTLAKNEIVAVWIDLLSSGCGHLYIVENEHWLPRLEGRAYAHNFCSFHFTSYITKDYAKRIVSTPIRENIALDFLRQYSDFMAGKVVSPAATAAEILKGNQETDGFGLYFISLLFVLHPNIKPSTLASEAAAEYSECIRIKTREIYGGFTYHAWMNNTAGAAVQATYVASGHKLLREYPDNTSKTDDEKHYLLCVTKDKQVSDALQIPPGVDCATIPGNWFSNLFVKRHPIADLTEVEQEAAYLLALGLSPEQIALRMHKSKPAVDAYQRMVCQKLMKANYPVDDNIREKIRAVILANLHEVRSVIVPLYPGW